jgi:hypothetical protein
MNEETLARAIKKRQATCQKIGFFRDTFVARVHLVSFNSEPLEQVSAWIEKTRRFWSARLDALDDLLRAEDAAATQEPNKKGKQK